MNYRKAVESWQAHANDCKSSVTRAMLVFDDGTPHVLGGTACHYCLTTPTPVYKTVNNKKIKYTRDRISMVVSGVQDYNRETIPEDMQLRFIDYLVNVSPFSPAFISKDPKQILEDGCFVVRPDIASNVMGAALITTRTLWEWHNRVYVWDAFTNAGCDPNISFILAITSAVSTVKWKRGHRNNSAYFTYEGMKEHIEVELFGDMGAWHRALDCSTFNIKSLHNFMTGNYVDENSLYTDYDDYHGTYRLFQNKDGGQLLSQFVLENMPKKKQGNRNDASIFQEVFDNVRNRYAYQENDHDYRSLTSVVTQFMKFVMPKLKKELDKL